MDLLETLEMLTTAGHREKYAMEHGKKTVIYHGNNKCYKYTYSEDDEYQDANGATYDTLMKKWIN